MKKTAILFLLLCSAPAFAQSNKNPGGEFQLGVRSTASLFNDAGSGIGTGAGGQFRLRFYEFLNSEWFADYLSSDFNGLGTRMDYHIGWSVMFYFTQLKEGNSNISRFKPYRPRPYFLTGHCFDYTRVRGNNPFYQSDADVHRWSSAIQAGIGMHIPMTPKVDLSTSAQYMYHMGKVVEAQSRTASNGDQFLYVTKEDNTGLEGHLLVTVSLNIRVADLWKDKHGALGNGPHVQEEDQ
jgi:hypothetical protein